MRIATPNAEDSKARRGNLMGAAKASPEKIDQVAREFEAQFISQMLENMFSTVDTKSGLGGSDEEEFYRDMMVDEYGKIISRSGGVGVADHVKREMLRLQEV
jgi:Rod binding domain-containing protein